MNEDTIITCVELWREDDFDGMGTRARGIAWLYAATSGFCLAVLDDAGNELPTYRTQVSHEELRKIEAAQDARRDTFARDYLMGIKPQQIEVKR